MAQSPLSTPNYVLRRQIGVAESGTLPVTAYPAGTAMMVSTVDPDTGVKTFVLANNRFDGFMSRDSRVTPGLTDEEQLFGFGLETPFLAGGLGSIEAGDRVELESTDVILDSVSDAVNGLSTATAAGTVLSFLAGKICKGASGQRACFRLVSQLTPVNDPLATRIYIEKIDGYLIP